MSAPPKRQLATVSLAVLTTLAGSALGPPPADATTAPKALVGLWRADCSSFVPREFAIETAENIEVTASHARTACRLAGQRALTPSRWYLDLECSDGQSFQLDINILGPDTLLVAPRPLGEACAFLQVEMK